MRSWHCHDDDDHHVCFHQLALVISVTVTSQVELNSTLSETSTSTMARFHNQQCHHELGKLFAAAVAAAAAPSGTSASRCSSVTMRQPCLAG
jgi:hypothetical protein